MRPAYGSRCAATWIPSACAAAMHRRQPLILGRPLTPPRDGDLVDPGAADLVHLCCQDLLVARRVQPTRRVVRRGDVDRRRVPVLRPVLVGAVERRRAVPGVVERHDPSLEPARRRASASATTTQTRKRRIATTRIMLAPPAVSMSQSRCRLSSARALRAGAVSGHGHRDGILRDRGRDGDRILGDRRRHRLGDRLRDGLHVRDGVGLGLRLSLRLGLGLRRRLRLRPTSASASASASASGRSSSARAGSSRASSSSR